MSKLDSISIKGFKSIRELNDLELRPLNILIGANGAGKSNFVKVFKLLNRIVDKRLQVFIGEEGGADNFLYFGQKTTENITIHLVFGNNEYECVLSPSDDGSLFFEKETGYFKGPGYEKPYSAGMGGGHKETQLHDYKEREQTIKHALKSLTQWTVYHFHDTSRSAKVRKPCEINDNEFLRPDASNLAAFLYYLREQHPLNYKNIVRIIRMAAPYFEDFDLKPDRLSQNHIRLEWRHAGSDAYFNGNALSDGTLRFICLTALLQQPNIPDTILLDEPELGLHPAAMTILAGMFRSVAQSGKTQVIASTQSVTLVNQFSPEDVIVVERENEQSVFKRLEEPAIRNWIEDYGVGDLWEKNVFGGRP